MGTFRSRKRKQKSQDEEKDYVPNVVHGKRLMLLVICVFSGWGGYELYTNGRVPLPIQSSNLYRTETVYIEGDLAYLMYLGMVLISISLIIKIIDHYDKRDNEKVYKVISKNILWAGIAVCLTTCFVK
jgi:hypothetical protein